MEVSRCELIWKVMARAVHELRLPPRFFGDRHPGFLGTAAPLPSFLMFKNTCVQIFAEVGIYHRDIPWPQLADSGNSVNRPLPQHRHAARLFLKVNFAFS